MYKEKKFNSIIKQICKEKEIKYSELSDDWIIKLKKKSKIKYIIGYKFELNSQSTADICNDKCALYSVLHAENIPIIQYNILYKYEEEKLEKYFNMFEKNVVIKPNNGTCGNNVIHTNNIEELNKEYKKIIEKNHSICICPFYDIKNEYRVIYLKEKQYIYKKVKPIIIGDGEKTIKELLKDFNNSYFSKEENLKNENIDINYIPKKNEKIEYEWRFNLSKGAIIEDVNDEEKKELIKLVNKVIDVIDLDFVSIDIVKLENNEFKIMESNSGVMMENLINLKEDGEKIAKSIYEIAIQKMFS